MSTEKEIAEWIDGVKIIASALNNIKDEKTNKNYSYAVIGSGACVLHGVNYADTRDLPADIDITSTNMQKTVAALSSLVKKGDISLKEEPDSNLAVKKFLITIKKTGKTVQCDVTHAQDFGFGMAAFTSVNGVQVTSLLETLKSLYLRPEHRLKDLIAFSELIKNNVTTLHSILQTTQLNSNLHNAIKTMVDIYSDAAKANNSELIVATVSKLLPRQDKNKVDMPAPLMTQTTQNLFSHAKTTAYSPTQRSEASRNMSAAERKERRDALRIERNHEHSLTRLKPKGNG